MTKIIAEIGWNHCGDMELAKQMITAAKESGASIAKFQTWSVDRLKPGPWDDDGRREIYEKAELSKDDHNLLLKHCDDVGIKFMTSVFSIEDAVLVEKLGCRTVKIPSFEIKNIPLIKYCFNNFDTVFISTGTATWEETTNIHRLHETLMGGPCGLVVMHCVSAYPCMPEHANLNHLHNLNQVFEEASGYSLGYSGHCPGVDVAKVALEYDNMLWIEKHFTTDHNLPGRDNKFAILPHEMKELSDYIELRENAKNYHGKGYQPIEKESREIQRGRFNG